jgi:serine/threonine protein kinase
MAPTPCPERTALAAFGRGDLADDSFEHVAAHVQECPTCQGVLAALEDSSDPVLAGMRRVRGTDPGARVPDTQHDGRSVVLPALTPPGYALQDAVGRGGMGVVYRARDERLNREVAVKLLREDSPADSAAAARFLAEAQITGQLQHPGIPAVHELGSLPDGRPFLAMKLVKGRTLHELLQEQPAGTGAPPPAAERGRLVAVFEQVCQAVGYAHAHRVIHRDLKPGNVMVGAFGEVQVMDWGLAKVLTPGAPAAGGDEPESPATVAAVTAIETPPGAASATRTGAVMGTPAYMPPEQAGGEVRKLDARSDVFGLGAILCQVLTGSPPYRGTDGHEVRLRAVRGDLADALARLDACGAEPELVALCRRCLAFKQEDRPADGGAVAREVAGIRLAAEERARRAELERSAALVREAEQRKRRRQFVAAAGVVTAALLAGIAGTTVGLIRAKRAVDAERLAKAEAEGRKTEAEQANDQAQKRLKQIERGNDILTSIFADLDIRAIKQGTEPLEAVLATRLVKAAGQLVGESVGDALVVASLQQRLGLALLPLGYAKEAIPLFEKARATYADTQGADHPDTLTSMNNLASSYHEAGQLTNALTLWEEVLRLRQATQGADHPDTLTSMNNLAVSYRTTGRDLAKALPLLEETLQLRKAKLGTDHPETLRSMNNLAGEYDRVGKLDKALPLWEETLRLRRATLGDDHIDTLTTLGHLAGGYANAGQLAKALPLLEEALRLRRAKLGTDHPLTFEGMNDLATGYRLVGQLDKAIPLLEETVRLTKARLGPEHPRTIGSMTSLALGYRATGQLDKAIPLLEEALRFRRAKLEPDHPETLQSMNNLASGYRDAGQLDKALPLLEETVRLCSAKLGADHVGTITSMGNLALGYQAAGQVDKAIPLLEEALRLRRVQLRSDHPHTLLSMNNLAVGYQAAGQLAKALPLLEETLRLMTAKLGSDHPDTLKSMGNLGVAYCEAKRGDEAVPLFAEYFQRQRKRTRPTDSNFAGELAHASQKLLTCDRFTEAESYLRECLMIREKAQPEDWTTFNTLSMLGGALLGQKKYADAEPLLLRGYEGMKKQADKIPPQVRGPRLTEAVERLVALYDGWGKADEAAKWRKELAER